LLAGAAEGLCLGAAQAAMLRGFGVRAGRWVALTVAAAVAGYALSAAGGAGSGETAAEPAVWLMAIMGAGLGLVMGALMGACQLLALGRRAPAGAWIGANAVGWSVGMAAIMLAAGSLGAEVPLAVVAVAGAGAGAVAGLAVGLTTMGVLERSVFRI
jgi:hypothetical protein